MKIISKIMSVPYATLASGVLVVAVCLAFGISPAAADAGSYTSSFACSNGMGVQGHYIIATGGGLVRADGMAGYIGNNGYLRRVLIREIDEGVEKGRRDISYSDGAKNVSILNTPTSYLPWMYNNRDHQAQVVVSIYSSTGASCGFGWAIN